MKSKKTTVKQSGTKAKEIMGKNENGYVSVIGPALIQPIFDLVGKLESKEPVPPNEVKTGQRENGYSLAIIVLGALLLESALNRTAYVRQEQDVDSEDRKEESRPKKRANRRPIPMPDYFKDISPDKSVAAEAEEVFAVRNVIAHNHLWEAATTWSETEDLKFVETPILRKGSGDDRHRLVTDAQTRKSRILGINMFPPRIWRRDAYIVLKTIAKALNVIETMDRGYFYLSPIHFRFQKRTVTFREVTDLLSIPKDI